MLFKRLREKDLKMIWLVSKGNRESFLVGTAHFFPYSFRTSLRRVLEKTRSVLFEGPLDETNMEKVVRAGFHEDAAAHLLDELDSRTVSGITRALTPAGLSSGTITALNMIAPAKDDFVRAMVKGMKPWMAFFRIYWTYLELNGWKYSVDMEAYKVAAELGKHIVFLETIDEQIQVLEGISRTQILDFLRRIENWPSYTGRYVKWYLAGDLDRIAANRFGFPTRDPWVIDRRDGILHERMLPHLESGQAAAFVGIPHVVGISKMLEAEGFKVKQLRP